MIRGPKAARIYGDIDNALLENDVAVKNYYLDQIAKALTIPVNSLTRAIVDIEAPEGRR